MNKDILQGKPEAYQCYWKRESYVVCGLVIRRPPLVKARVRERGRGSVESWERGSRTLAGDSGQVNFLTGEGQWESQLTRPGWANRQHPALNKSTNPTNNWNPAAQKARLRLYRIRIALTADVRINHFRKPNLTEEMSIGFQKIFVFWIKPFFLYMQWQN